MIRVIHGDDRVSSRKHLGLIVEDARKRGAQITRVDGSANPSDLLTKLRSLGLFSREKLIVVEDFFSDKGVVSDGLRDALCKVEGDVVFWEGKEVAGKKLGGLEKITKDILLFKVPAQIFKFLDSLYPGNSKAIIKLLRAVLDKGDHSEFLLFMIARQIRLLLWAKLDPENLILAPWQKAKILEQSSLWKKNELSDFHHKLVQLDRGNKQSRLAVDFTSSLELLLLYV